MINKDILANVDLLRKHFTSGSPLEIDNIKVISVKDGFPVAHISSLFESPAFVRDVRDDLMKLEWTEKNNDLYTFLQSQDLKNVSEGNLLLLTEYLSSKEFINVLCDMTGISLQYKAPDIAAQRYQRGGNLLCHDDDILEGESVRRIAFIIYLVSETWSEADGGQLDIFSSHDGNPKDIVASIIPKWNSLAFFKVTPCSYHQVREVLSDNEERISITGWYYGEPDLKPSPEIRFNLDQPMLSISNETKFKCSDWISSSYLKNNTLKQICNYFCNESFVQLNEILKPEIFQKISTELKQCKFVSVGPANVCKFKKIIPEIDSKLFQLFSFLRSKAFAEWLTKVTMMKMGYCVQEMRMFCAQDYTLVHDQYTDPVGIDVYICLLGRSVKWSDESGGCVFYISEDEDLLQISPESNQITIVYRNDGNVKRFVKYLTRQVPSNIPVINCTYIVEEDEEEK